MRLDCFLVEKEYFSTRTKARQAIERGEIYINDLVVTKPSFLILDDNVKVSRICKREYVSLGGFKLEKALSDFNFDVQGLVVADIGASTGGFTDCLLKNGAKKVYAVDLRDDLLHQSLICDDRVSLVVKNAKELKSSDFNDELDLIVADLSFISLSQVLNVFYSLIHDGKKLIILIKPQFETGKKIKFKNGIIKDNNIHKQVCMNVYDYAVENKLCPLSITTAPISNGKNIEFLILLEKNGKAVDRYVYEKMIKYS